MLRFQKRIQEHLSGPAPTAQRLAEMAKNQEFLTSSRDVDTLSMGDQPWQSLNRLRMLAQRIDAELQNSSADQHAGILDRYEVSAVDATNNFYALIRTIDPIIDKQSATVNELTTQIAVLEKA